MLIWCENKDADKRKTETLVDTNQCEEPKTYSSTTVLVRALRDKISSEMAAANEYSQMIESLNDTLHLRKYQLADGNVHQSLVSIINRLSEIRNDEENHAGVLLQCIQMLDPEVIKNGIKGFGGKESVYSPHRR
jgi:rubrerythrin